MAFRGKAIRTRKKNSQITIKHFNMRQLMVVFVVINYKTNIIIGNAHIISRNINNNTVK